jgi:prevent-host-death family protein
VVAGSSAELIWPSCERTYPTGTTCPRDGAKLVRLASRSQGPSEDLLVIADNAARRSRSGDEFVREPAEPVAVPLGGESSIVDPGHDPGHGASMQVSKSQLKAMMLDYFRRVEETGEELVVTDNGRPVWKVVPIAAKRPIHEVFADLQGKAVVHGDIMEDTSDEWPEK